MQQQQSEIQADVHVEPLEDEYLLDQLINPEEYEPPCHTPEGHATTEILETNEAQRR